MELWLLFRVCFFWHWALSNNWLVFGCLLAHMRSRARINRRVCSFSLSSIVFFFSIWMFCNRVSSPTGHRSKSVISLHQSLCVCVCVFWWRRLLLSPPIKISGSSSCDIRGVITRDRWTSRWCEDRCWNLALNSDKLSSNKIRPSQKCRDRTGRALLWVWQLISAQTNPHAQLSTQSHLLSGASVVIQHSDGSFSFIVERERRWWMIAMTSHTCVAVSLSCCCWDGHPPCWAMATAFTALVCQSRFGNLGPRPCFLCSQTLPWWCQISELSEIARKKRTPVFEKERENREKKESEMKQCLTWVSIGG